MRRGKKKGVEAGDNMSVSRKVLGLALVGLIVAACVAGQGPTITQEEDLTDEQKEYYENVFAQYDVDHDGFITMEENIEQDKAIAEEAGKPFDEVRVQVPVHGHMPRPRLSVAAL